MRTKRAKGCWPQRDACHTGKGRYGSSGASMLLPRRRDRHDLRADTLARWIVRNDFSLIAQPARPEGVSDEGYCGTARRLLTTGLAP